MTPAKKPPVLACDKLPPSMRLRTMEKPTSNLHLSVVDSLKETFIPYLFAGSYHYYEGM